MGRTLGGLQAICNGWCLNTEFPRNGDDSYRVSLGLPPLYSVVSPHLDSYQLHTSLSMCLEAFLDYVRKLSGGAAEYVAVLDSDMMPRPDWLRTMVVPLLLDPKVAMAQPPQRFYNIPTADPFSQNTSLVYDGVEPVKSCTSSTWCYGTGYVVRRQAMEQIGGYPTANICDDLLTSMYIVALGWKIVYVHEDVQWGLVATTVPAFIGQQKRWFLSSLCAIESLWSHRAKGVAPVRQRFRAAVLGLVQAFVYPVLGLTIVVMPWLLISESEIVTYNTRNQLRTLLLLQCASFASELLSGYYRAHQAGFTCQIHVGPRQLGLTPYHMVTFVKFFTPRAVEILIIRALRPFRSAFPKQDGYKSSNSSQVIKERRSGIQDSHFVLGHFHLKLIKLCSFSHKMLLE